LHDPKASEGFVGSALNAKMYRFFKTESGDWAAEKVIDIPTKKVSQDMKPKTSDLICLIIG